MNKVTLNETEQRLLEYLKNKENYRIPTIETMRVYLGLKSKSHVHKMIVKFRKLNLI